MWWQLPPNTGLEGRIDLKGSESFPKLVLPSLLSEYSSSWKAAIGTLAEDGDRLQSVTIAALQIGAGLSCHLGQPVNHLAR